MAPFSPPPSCSVGWFARCAFRCGSAPRGDAAAFRLPWS
jgi:hypothetical protein